MVDILKGIFGSAGNYVIGWVMPLAFAVLAFVFAVLGPAGVVLDEGLLTGNAVLATVLLALSVLAGGLMLSAFAGHLYRVLEGYHLPKSLREKGVRRQLQRKRELQVQRGKAGTELERALLAEQLDRFPIDEGQTAPTTFGNAIRAFETFGVDRYRLDSQAFWVELTTVAPEHLRAEIGRARAAVDFFVAEVFLAAVFGLAAVAVWAREPHPWSALVAAVLAWVATPAFYRGAVTSTTYWCSTVRALVNLGRVDLAQGFGLTLPATLEDERLMWERLAGFTYYPFEDSWVSLLDEFRAGPRAGEGGSAESPGGSGEGDASGDYDI